MATCIKISCIVLLSLVLLTSPIDGRHDPNEYWVEMVKGQSMPEALKNFINQRTFEGQDKEEAIKDFIKVFDPIPNVSAYHDDATQKEIKSQTKDCNNEQEASKKQFAKEFEPIPNVSAYNE